jgi:membrane fusion protein, multidrug efflux system
MSRPVRLIVSGLLIAIGVAWLWFARSSLPGPAKANLRNGVPDPLVPVMAGAVERADVPVVLAGLGTVRAFNSVLLTSRVDGQIVRISFSEGQLVHADDVVVEIDPRPYQAALDQAQAQLPRDEALLAAARVDLARYEKLVTQDSIARQQVDTQRSAVKQDEAIVRFDRANVENAALNLNYCSVRSPIDGRTGTRLIDLGNIIRASATMGIVVINQTKPISVEFNLPAESLPQIRARVTSGIAVIALDRNERELAAGRLTVIDNQVSVTTGTVRYKATFDNTDEVLWPGQFVGIRLHLDILRGANTVPTTAVVRGPDGTYAFVIDNTGTTQKRPIRIGASTPMITVIESGLQPGERVVTDGQYRIQAGTRVKVLPQVGQSPN